MYVFISKLVALVGNKNKGSPVGPEKYNVGTSLKFVRNTHTFNIMNNMLFGEMRRIQNKSPEEETRSALSLYKSPALDSVLNQYSSEGDTSVRLEKERLHSAAIRDYQKKRKQRSRQRSYELRWQSTAEPPKSEEDLQQSEQAEPGAAAATTVWISA